MQVDLAEVVEEVRAKYFESTVDPEVAREVLEVEARHVEDRVRASEEVARVISRYTASGDSQ